MKVYLAAPVVGISDAKKNQIYTIVGFLRATKDIEVFVPSEIKVEGAWNFTIEEWSACVFNMDAKAIRECDALIVCDYGRQGTAGTSWEVGFAYGIGKPIFEIMCAPDGEDYSLMIHKCASNFITYNELIEKGFNKDTFFIERGRAQQLKDVLN